MALLVRKFGNSKGQLRPFKGRNGLSLWNTKRFSIKSCLLGDLSLPISFKETMENGNLWNRVSIFARISLKIFRNLQKFSKRRAKIQTRFYKFAFFIVFLIDIGKIRPPSRQLFMLNLFVFQKKRPFRPLNALDWPFEFPIFC